MTAFVVMKNACKMIWRQRHVASVRVLFLSLLVAVMAVSTLSMVSTQLKSAMISSATRFIAGDRQLISPREVEPEWLSYADSLGLNVSRSIEFASMLYSEQSMQLVAVKAVDDLYPLIGKLEVYSEERSRLEVSNGPSSGQVWLPPRLLNLLALNKGDEVFVGEKALSLSHEIAHEPDGGFQVFDIAPRAMIHLDDVVATEVIKPGSRLTWRYYFSGQEQALTDFDKWLETRLDKAQRWEGVKEGRPAISDALTKTETYLLLGGSLSVLLACIAIVMSARQFSLEQINAVALMKSLGQTGTDVIFHYFMMLFVLAFVASMLGMIGGAWLSGILALSIEQWVPDLEVSDKPKLDFRVWVLVLGTSLIALFGFALPEFFKLRNVSPMKIFREDADVAMAWSWKTSFISVLLIFGLLWAYGQNGTLILLLMLSLVGVVGFILILAWCIYAYIGKRKGRYGTQVGKPFKHALSSLHRQRGHTVIQLCVFSFTLLLVSVIWLARDSLLQDWQNQLPDDTPNHFLINIAPSALDQVKQTLNHHGIETSGLYPMVRGRLSHINQVPVKVAVTKDVGALNRELNLTWSEALPEDNKIEQGEWWKGRPDNKAEPHNVTKVSVESRLAERLELDLGDQLTFSIGGRALQAEIRSIRSVQWDSMRPNFYMMFEPDSLTGFPATYITSFYLADDQKNVLNDLSKRFPTVSILELDRLIEKVKGMIHQVSTMVEIILVFIFVSALLVMSALISNSMPERKREAALLRTLGAEKALILRAQFYEFALLALISAFTAVIFSEIVMALLQVRLFGASSGLHWPLWVFMPAGAVVVIGAIAHVQIRAIPNTSPMIVLRS